MDGLRMGHELVEHLRTVRQFLVILAVAVQQSDGLAVAAVGIAEPLHLPVQVAERQQQHTLLHTISHRLLISFLVGADGLQRVALVQVDIAEGVIHLVEVFLVVIRFRHPFQTTDHLAAFVGRHHLRLGDAGVELRLVGRMTAHHLLIGLIGRLAVAQQVLNLSHQEPLPGLLRLATLVLDGLAQIGHSLLVVARADIVVGVGVIPVVHGAEVHRVAAHIAYHVLGIVEPAEFRIAFRQPGFRQTALHGLRLIEARHIGEGGSGLVEGTLLELRLAQ